MSTYDIVDAKDVTNNGDEIKMEFELIRDDGARVTATAVFKRNSPGPEVVESEDPGAKQFILFSMECKDEAWESMNYQRDLNREKN